MASFTMIALVENKIAPKSTIPPATIPAENAELASGAATSAEVVCSEVAGTTGLVEFTDGDRFTGVFTTPAKEATEIKKFATNNQLDTEDSSQASCSPHRANR